MIARIWHRLRGHKVRRFTRHTNTSQWLVAGVLVEAGRIDRGFECSCGESWLTHQQMGHFR